MEFKKNPKTEYYDKLLEYLDDVWYYNSGW